ncbi:hypothetical protein HDV00_001724 [Rhizophlyctis rosea]|nr:hypothetical protein HDV00_001724 [Rhizophlyctis rosea]
MPATKILLLGATGYIGGSILPVLLEAQPPYAITALVRDASRASDFQSLGVTTVLGSLDDTALLTQLASDSDVVFNAADADQLPATEAIIKGLESRTTPTNTGKKPILIHTSGTGVLLDGANGNFTSEKVYYDKTMEDIDALPPTALHRNVDLAILEGSKRGKFTSVIVAPPLIYGLGTGIHNKHSVQVSADLLKSMDTKRLEANLLPPSSHQPQVPTLIRGCIQNSHAIQVGHGKNIWSNVHILDLADAYILLLQNLLSPNPTIPTNAQGYYFVENGEHNFADLSLAIAKVLKEKANIGDGTVVSLREEHRAGFGKWGPAVELLLGGNSRSRAEKLRELGWRPTRPGLFETIEEEVVALLKEAGKV